MKLEYLDGVQRTPNFVARNEHTTKSLPLGTLVSQIGHVMQVTGRDTCWCFKCKDKLEIPDSWFQAEVNVSPKRLDGKPT